MDRDSRIIVAQRHAMQAMLTPAEKPCPYRQLRLRGSAHYIAALKRLYHYYMAALHAWWGSTNS